MTNAGIEAFLIVCKQHSISKAAELFISQSSLSIRLRTLEKEVGCPLFFRHKGSREMVLTEEGKRFYQLSLQYQDIVRSMLAIGNRKSSLRLSALNSVSTYLLPPVYEQFMRDHPDIHLEIQDMTVEAACQSLLRGETDLAFTSDVPRTDAIRAELVMAEPMDLICAAGSCYSDGIGAGRAARPAGGVRGVDRRVCPLASGAMGRGRGAPDPAGDHEPAADVHDQAGQLGRGAPQRGRWAVRRRREAAGCGVPLTGAPHPRAAEKGGKLGGCAAVSGHHPPAVGRSGGMSAKPRQRG